MTFFEQFFSNTIFLTAAFGWLVAQVLKTLIHLIVGSLTVEYQEKYLQVL